MVGGRGGWSKVDGGVQTRWSAFGDKRRKKFIVGVSKCSAAV